MPTIYYKTVNRYGNMDRVPLDPEWAEGWAICTGRKTIRDQDIEGLRLMGVEAVPDEPEETT